MYRISPPALYIHERVLANGDAVRRMERMMAAIDFTGEPQVVDDARLDAISEAEAWSAMGSKRTGELTPSATNAEFGLRNAESTAETSRSLHPLSL